MRWKDRQRPSGTNNEQKHKNRAQYEYMNEKAVKQQEEKKNGNEQNK